jgi:hypothetical protein
MKSSNSLMEIFRMAKLLQYLSAIFFGLALIGVTILLVFDAANRLKFTAIHRHAGAFSFMLIGSSYLSLLFSSGRPLRKMLKEIFLGIAFLLWGCEQFLPPTRIVTAMDTAVVLIFVIDLSWIIVERLKNRHDATSKN